MREQTFIRPGLEVGFRVVTQAKDIVPAIMDAVSTTPPSAQEREILSQL
jgi:hypothetical protein